MNLITVLLLFMWKLLHGLCMSKTWSGLVLQKTHASQQAAVRFIFYMNLPIKSQGTHSVWYISIVAMLSAQLLSRAQMQTCLKKRRPKCPWAWVWSTLVSTPLCRIGCCIPRHLSLEQEGDCIKSFISLSVAFQKSTWTPREHGALQPTAKQCATSHRVSREHWCQWSAPPAT